MEWSNRSFVVSKVEEDVFSRYRETVYLYCAKRAQIAPNRVVPRITPSSLQGIEGVYFLEKMKGEQ